MWLVCLTKSSLDEKGSREVGIRYCGASHMRLTVLLCARADGHKLRPLVVLNRKRVIPELDKFRCVYLTLNVRVLIKLLIELLYYSNRLELIYGKQQSWIEYEKLDYWLRHCVSRNIFERSKFLVWDELRAHYSDATKYVLRDLRIDLFVIYGKTFRV